MTQDALTVQLEYFDQSVGQKWIIFGSDPDYSMGLSGSMMMTRLQH